MVWGQAQLLDEINERREGRGRKEFRQEEKEIKEVLKKKPSHVNG